VPDSLALDSIAQIAPDLSNTEDTTTVEARERRRLFGRRERDSLGKE